MTPKNLPPDSLPLPPALFPAPSGCWGNPGEKFSKFGVRWEPCKYVRYVHTGKGGKKHFVLGYFLVFWVVAPPHPKGFCTPD